ncbi:hypothetical protein BU15DRAFT_63821 [Melanogaster broomeanus]|nr:hypothetical protein BU15DRAFT_63821 [Melanogaster broomeanus]
MTNAEKPFVNKPDNDDYPDSDSDEAGYRPEPSAAYTDDAGQSSDPYPARGPLQGTVATSRSQGGKYPINNTGARQDPRPPPRQFSTNNYAGAQGQQPKSDKNKGNKKLPRGCSDFKFSCSRRPPIRLQPSVLFSLYDNSHAIITGKGVNEMMNRTLDA